MHEHTKHEKQMKPGVTAHSLAFQRLRREEGLELETNLDYMDQTPSQKRRGGEDMNMHPSVESDCHLSIFMYGLNSLQYTYATFII